jgi:hypothetical protein
MEGYAANREWVPLHLSFGKRKQVPPAGAWASFRPPLATTYYIKYILVRLMARPWGVGGRPRSGPSGPQPNGRALSGSRRTEAVQISFRDSDATTGSKQRDHLLCTPPAHRRATWIGAKSRPRPSATSPCLASSRLAMNVLDQADQCRSSPRGSQTPCSGTQAVTMPRPGNRAIGNGCLARSADFPIKRHTGPWPPPRRLLSAAQPPTSSTVPCSRSSKPHRNVRGTRDGHRYSASPAAPVCPLRCG